MPGGPLATRHLMPGLPPFLARQALLAGARDPQALRLAEDGLVAGDSKFRPMSNSKALASKLSI